MSEELTKEMENVDEVDEATAEPTGVKAKEPGASNPSSTKLKQEKEDLQKAKTSGKAADPKASKASSKAESKHDEDEDVEKEEQ